MDVACACLLVNSPGQAVLQLQCTAVLHKDITSIMGTTYTSGQPEGQVHTVFKVLTMKQEWRGALLIFSILRGLLTWVHFRSTLSSSHSSFRCSFIYLSGIINTVLISKGIIFKHFCGVAVILSYCTLHSALSLNFCEGLAKACWHTLQAYNLLNGKESGKSQNQVYSNLLLYTNACKKFAKMMQVPVAIYFEMVTWSSISWSCVWAVLKVYNICPGFPSGYVSDCFRSVQGLVE